MSSSGATAIYGYTFYLGTTALMCILGLALAFPTAFEAVYPVLPARHWLPTLPLFFLFFPTTLALTTYLADILISTPPLDSPLALVTRTTTKADKQPTVAAWLGGHNTMEASEADPRVVPSPSSALPSTTSDLSLTIKGQSRGQLQGGTDGGGTDTMQEVPLMLQQDGEAVADADADADSTSASFQASPSSSSSSSISSSVSSSRPTPLDTSTTIAVYTPSLIQTSTTGLPPIGELSLDVVNEILYGGC